jgi:glutamyl-Q tRNA(Asp) synthetase
LVAALASYLDARAHHGLWLVRIEDVDPPRCVPGADQIILQQLAACGLHADEAPVWQRQRSALYQRALQQLTDAGLAYACGCTRKDIEMALAALGNNRARHTELIYPGTCRDGLHGKPARAWRLNVGAIKTEATASDLMWFDRRLGKQTQNVTAEVGDFVLKRADGLWAYQLAVVVDDADQHISHVVRGQDLADNTPRQIVLQQALGLPTPQYLHTPLVLDARGEKLSKQHGAVPIDVSTPHAALQSLSQAAHVLGLPSANSADIDTALHTWTNAWMTAWKNVGGGA